MPTEVSSPHRSLSRRLSEVAAGVGLARAGSERGDPVPCARQAARSRLGAGRGRNRLGTRSRTVEVRPLEPRIEGLDHPWANGAPASILPPHDPHPGMRSPCSLEQLRGVSSVEPSSTTTTCAGGSVWRSIQSSVRPMWRASSRQGAISTSRRVDMAQVPNTRGQPLPVPLYEAAAATITLARIGAPAHAPTSRRAPQAQRDICLSG